MPTRRRCVRPLLDLGSANGEEQFGVRLYCDDEEGRRTQGNYVRRKSYRHKTQAFAAWIMPRELAAGVAAVEGLMTAEDFIGYMARRGSVRGGDGSPEPGRPRPVRAPVHCLTCPAIIGEVPASLRLDLSPGDEGGLSMIALKDVRDPNAHGLAQRATSTSAGTIRSFDSGSTNTR
jgi:hypothetical protein